MIRTEGESGVVNEANSDDSNQNTSAEREKPAQELCKKKIAKLQEELNVLLIARNTFYNEAIDKQVKKKEQELESEKKNLKRKVQSVNYMQKSRKKKKEAIQKVISQYPETENILKLREAPGRPRMEEEQPGLHQAIIDISIFGSGADDRRRSEMIRSVRTLDDLHAELVKNGFTLSRLDTEKKIEGFIKFLWEKKLLKE